MLRTALLAGAVSLAATAAHAAITWSALPGLGTPEAGDLVIDFDSALPAGVTLTFAGDGGIYQGSSGTYAAPYGDTTKYLSSGIGSAALTFDEPQRSVQLDWSSVDLYNTLQLFDGSMLVGTLTGGQVEPGASGDRGPAGTYNVRVDVSADQNWDTLVASSTHYAFELDNVAASAAAPPSTVGNPTGVPEPNTLAIFGACLTGLGLATRKRTRKSDARR